MGRAPCCDKANVKKGPWSPEEDAKLKAYIEKYGTGGNWIALPQKIGLKRCGKSCRLRWLNYLRPNIKHGGFTEEEDNIICSLYISIGSRWSIIAAQLPGRTDNDIKNYWNTRLKKKLLGRRKQSNTNRIPIPGHDPKDLNHEEESSYNLQNLSSSALERLQLHMQLQNPFSFYNNPALWPNKNINPREMIQTVVHSEINPNTDHLLHQLHSSPDQLRAPDQQDYNIIPNLSNLRRDDNQNSVINDFSSSERNNVLDESDQIMERNGGVQINSGFTQAELDDLININNKSSTCGFVPATTESCEIQIAETDCFKEMDGSKDNLGWWGSDFDASSSSLSSWDSAAAMNNIHGPSNEEMYQDYVIGYDHMH